jgi:hypothetical protein
MYRGVIVFLFSAVLVADTLPAGQSASGDWTINCGLWRTDAGFTSIIQLKKQAGDGSHRRHAGPFHVGRNRI